MARIALAWELGGGTGHVATLLPVARALRARGHEVRMLLREPRAGADLDGVSDIAREAAPVWRGLPRHPNPLNLGEILHNFGYGDPEALRELVEAWRERLRDAHAVIANVAPAAHVAARTLGIASFEASQGFHVPPPAMPSAPLRDWEPAPRARLEAADRAVLAAINAALTAHGTAPIATLGELFAGRSMLLTYPELDIYSERGPSEYFGVPLSSEGGAAPGWPAERGSRVLAYLYRDYRGLEPMLDALAKRRGPSLVFVRGLDAAVRARHAAGPVRLSPEPLAVTGLLPAADLVICHASHQMTAQALLAGKPVLLVPTQLEQFLIMRRVVRQGAGLGIAPETPQIDFAAALDELQRNPRYGAAAREFAHRYRAQDRAAALDTIVRRCEAAIGAADSR